MASLDLKPSGTFLQSSEPWLFCLEEKGLGSRPRSLQGGQAPFWLLRPVGSLWAGAQRCISLPSRHPWTCVLFQILTTVLTGHVPN